MLTEAEKDGFARFFQEFPIHELLSLVETVTNRMVTVQRKQEAIKAIIIHSESALELLGRKKVKKEYIFRHLASENVPVLPTSDKTTLARKFLQHCGTQLPDLSQFDETEEVFQETKCRQTETVLNNIPDQHVTLPVGQPTPHSPSNVQELAEQFASWFYRQLNSLGQTMPGVTDWGPQHFWNDSKLNLRIMSHERREETFEGAELVAQRLKSFVCEEGLLFNANLSPAGTSGLDDPHGLVIVRVCGTVHQGIKCLGLFEQQFGLIRDPLKENTWKIKFTDMNMKQAAVNCIPTLDGSSDMSVAVG